MSLTKPNQTALSIRDNHHPIRVVITEASNYIARSLAYRLLTERIFGSDQQIVLNLFDYDNSIFLESLAIEITACAPTLLKDISYTNDPWEAFHNVDVVFLLGKARDYNFVDSDSNNSDPFFRDSVLEAKRNAEAIDRYAKKDVKVITLSNTSASIIAAYAPSIPKENVTAVTLALQKFIAFTIAKKINRLPSEVKNLIIWGTNSKENAFPYCDYSNFGDNNNKSVKIEINDDTWCKKVLPKQLLDGVFGKCRYRLSEAVALADHCKYLTKGTPKDEWISMGVISDGSYGVTSGVFFSFPVYCRDGRWEIVKDLNVDAYCGRILKEITVRIEKKHADAMKICREAVVERYSVKSIRKSIMKIR